MADASCGWGKNMWQRRSGIAFLVGLLWSSSVVAQQPRLPVVGFLNSASPAGYSGMAASFRQGLKQAGFEGENVLIEYRWANDDYRRLPDMASELVKRGVAVIFANSPSIPHAKAATNTIPVVFSSGDDPVRLGFVTSLNKPGGNITGVAIMSGELASKRLALLCDLIPGTRKVAVLINTDFGPSGRFRTDVEAAALALGVELLFLPASQDREIEEAFATLSQNKPDSLLVGPGPFLDSRRNQLVALAEKARLPAGYEQRASAQAGGLTSYGADVVDAYRQAGIYAGRILKGERPAEMPVALATKVEFVINLKTAKKLNIQINQQLLTAADEIIE
jgi:putative tryptophan/tyrosine transport system substrate-binding protein